MMNIAPLHPSVKPGQHSMDLDERIFEEEESLVPMRQEMSKKV